MDKKDIREERYRSTGNGGQNVNKVESAIRLTHIPTGITAQSQDERSQHQNRAKALAVLEKRVAAKERVDSLRSRQQLRESLYQGRVRTYDFSSNTVTDYRTKKQTSRLKDVLDGNLDLIISRND